MEQPVAPEAAKLAHHAAILERLVSVEVQVAGLEQLRDRVENTQRDTPEKAEQEQLNKLPSLATFLIEAPDRLQVIEARLEKIREELQVMLFG